MVMALINTLIQAHLSNEFLITWLYWFCNEISSCSFVGIVEENTCAKFQRKTIVFV